MSPLSAKARALIAAGRDGLRPPGSERDRLEALIDARLAAGTAAPAGGALSLVGKSWYIALGVALAGGAATSALSTPRTPEVPPLSTTRISRARSAPDAMLEPVAPTAVAVTRDETAASGSAAAPRAQKDQLAHEVALLLRATRALRAGRAADALEALDEHKRQFPSGLLAVDRRAARAQALCSLKRFGEGRAELARLAPQSPAAARTKQLCDAADARPSRP
jgi:hypothetical protein